MVAARSSTSGRTLFSSLYALFVVLSLAVGNDPVVLSGTPFVAYFTQLANISPPTPFLFAQFQAANLASALLVSSNPTNLVLTSSFHLSLLSFSAWTALPTVAAAVALYPTLLVQFRKRIPKTLNPPKVNPRAALTDPFGAIFTATIFLTCIVVLVALSAVGLLEGVQGVWAVTAPAAILVLARDCIHDLRRTRPHHPSGGTEDHIRLRNSYHPIAIIRHRLPTVCSIISRLPLPLLPFAFSMFILVDALEYTGWVSVWANWWAAWARVGGTAGCIWLMGMLSVLGCNVSDCMSKLIADPGHQYRPHCAPLAHSGHLAGRSGTIKSDAVWKCPFPSHWLKLWRLLLCVRYIKSPLTSVSRHLSQVCYGAAA